MRLKLSWEYFFLSLFCVLSLSAVSSCVDAWVRGLVSAPGGGCIRLRVQTPSIPGGVGRGLPGRPGTDCLLPPVLRASDPSLGPEKRLGNFGRKFANFALGEAEAARRAGPATGCYGRGGPPARPGTRSWPGCPRRGAKPAGGGPLASPSRPWPPQNGPSPWVSKQPRCAAAPRAARIGNPALNASDVISLYLSRIIFSTWLEQFHSLPLFCFFLSLSFPLSIYSISRSLILLLVSQFPHSLLSFSPLSGPLFSSLFSIVFPSSSLNLCIFFPLSDSASLPLFLISRSFFSFFPVPLVRSS